MHKIKITIIILVAILSGCKKNGTPLSSGNTITTVTLVANGTTYSLSGYLPDSALVTSGITKITTSFGTGYVLEAQTKSLFAPKQWEFGIFMPTSGPLNTGTYSTTYTQYPSAENNGFSPGSGLDSWMAVTGDYMVVTISSIQGNLASGTFSAKYSGGNAHCIITNGTFKNVKILQ